MQEIKVCNECGKEKAIDQYYKNGHPRKNGTYSRQAICKQCQHPRTAAWGKIWRLGNKERHQKTSAAWAEKHHLSKRLSCARVLASKLGYLPCSATIKELEDAFTGYCAICGKSEKNCKQRLCIDHNHDTGKFRGFLCSNCNRGGGMFSDNPVLLRKAAEYFTNRG